MKGEFPKYSNGDLIKIESTLSIHNKAILNDFLEHCSTTAQPLKVGKIKRVLLQLNDITEIDFDKLDKKTLTSYLVILNHSNRSGWTKNEAKVYVKKFLKWYYKDLELLELIKTTAKDKQVSINENDLLTETEFERMIENCDNVRKKSLLTLFWESGARPEEILNLKWKDVIFNDNFAEISFFSHKTNATRVFPVKKAKEFLWFYKQQYPYPKVKGNDFVFCNPENRDSRITTAALNKIIRKVAVKAGIQKDVWAYLFRHSRATKLYEELPQQIVEKLLGHKDMAKVYAHISNKKAKEELISKIYHIEDLPESKKLEFEKKLKEITDYQNKLKKEMEVMSKILKMQGFEPIDDKTTF